MKNIVCFSDTHGQHRKLSYFFEKMNTAADIIIFAGDLQHNSYDIGKDFVEWFHRISCDNKIMIFGNHDSNHALTREFASKYSDIKVLSDSGVCIDGINIYGSPYSVEFGNWFFMKPEDELAAIYKKIPDDTNILITHTPQKTILDKTRFGENAGSSSLKIRISDLKNLRLHVCGHIHESAGFRNMKKYGAMNCSVLNADYDLAFNPQHFEYQDNG